MEPGKQKKSLNGQITITRLAGRLAGWILRLLFVTCRVELLNSQVQHRYLDQGVPSVGATWHRGALFSIYYFARYKPAIMVSRSRDGEYLAHFIKACGARPVRGSSSRGGMTALREMLRLLRSDVKLAATVADGPQGPPYQAKPGMVMLAARSGRMIVPVVWSTNRAWVFKKAWDRHMLPKPFARIKMAYGQPIEVPSDTNAEGLEAYRLLMERELNRLREQVDGLCGHVDP
jgi:lysophospholipid acyltransferase (LPLAT)-like uncharacterized protein